MKVEYDSKKKVWKILPARSKKGMHIDGILKQNLDIAKDVIKKDWDMLFAIDGMEGSGKTTIASQIATYCDPTFNIDRMTFTPKQFKEAVLNAKAFQAVVYDEGYGGLSSRATMSRVNRALVRMLTEIRMKNLFIFVIIPCFFDLDKYVALWRSRVLIHVYIKGKFKRGQFMFFNMDRKKSLYMLGKKFYSYSKPDANFYGSFTAFFPVDKKEYTKRKVLAVKTEEEEMKEIATITREIKKEIAANIESMKLTNKQKAGILGVADRTIYRYLSDMKENV